MKIYALITILLLLLAGCNQDVPPEPSSPGTGGQYVAVIPTWATEAVGFSAEYDQLKVYVDAFDDFVYKKGFIWNEGADSWESFTISGSSVGSSNWLSDEGSVDFEISQSYIDENNELFVVVYTCSDDGTSYDCHGSQWQMEILEAGCSDDYDPVCGTDGVTYDNQCEADFAGVTVDYEKACLEDPGSVGNFELSEKECSNLVPLYRFFNSEITDHFYTTGEKEYLNLVEGGTNWKYEGIAGYVFSSDLETSDLQKLYRYWSGSDHFYSTSANTPTNYEKEGFAGYVLKSDDYGSVPLYRFYNSVGVDHFYTASQTEYDNLVSGDSGWDYEGIEGYIFKYYPKECGALPASSDSVSSNSGDGAACTATTSCSSAGYECGTVDDGCGNTLSCGTCSSGTCSSGQCIACPTTSFTYSGIPLDAHIFKPIGSAKVSSAEQIFDFDGDGVHDKAVWTEGKVYYLQSSDCTIQSESLGFSASGDESLILAPMDDDGDGITDITGWVVGSSGKGTYYIKFSSTGDLSTQSSVGYKGDFPVPGDWDGDGDSEMAFTGSDDDSGSLWWSFYDDSAGSWVYLYGGYVQSMFGQIGDIPVPADYDLDGKIDQAIYRPSTYEWWIKYSESGSIDTISFGSAGAEPFVIDFDGDGDLDLGVIEDSDARYRILKLGDDSATTYDFNNYAWTPVPGDYDGDGVMEFVVYSSEGKWKED